jgi:hypothetical protein
MTPGRDQIERLLQTVAETAEDLPTRQAAIARLRKRTLDAPETARLMDIVENHEAAPDLRRMAVQILGYHRPWRSLDLFHDDRIHTIPGRLAALAVHPAEDRSVRETLIPAIGWQYLSEHRAWPALLSDPDPYLRREALYELLRDPHRDGIEQVIRHVAAETEPAVRNAMLWGMARHPLFYDAALVLLARTGGDIPLDTVTDACATDPATAVRALLNADMKYFEIRETLIRRLFQELDAPRIACLLTLMQENTHQFAVRMLREADEAAAAAVIRQLDPSVHDLQNADWTEEATKLILHYWDRFESLRPVIRDILGVWRAFSPKVTHLAMGRGIYW